VQEPFQQHLLALIGERHPVSAPEGLARAEHYLVRQFESYGLAVRRHGVDVGGRIYANLIGELQPPANAATRPALIVAAHYDTVPHSPGADDNGSGLAVMLETARRMKDCPVRRPIRFIAFCLEEAELLGSCAYVAEVKANGEDLEGAIVLECVGYIALEKGSQQAPAGLPIAIPQVGDFLAMIGNESSLLLIRAMEEAARQQVADLPVVSLVVPGQGDLFPDVRRSDHAAFWQHGYPAVMLTDTANFRNPHYHRPTDTIETLDFGFMEQVTRLLIAACLKLAGPESI
jgi:aminopeptidase YwaD